MSSERKPHLSATQLTMLSRCGLQYYWRYIKGIRRPPGSAATLGKGTHRAIEANLRAKMSWGQLLSEEEVKQKAAEATAAAWDEEPPQLDDDERAAGADKVKGELVDTAVVLASLHHKQAAPKIEPIAIEQEFTIEIDGSPYDLLGYKDIETATHIRDTKTPGKTPSADAAERSVQLTLYHLETKLRTGEDKRVALDNLVKGRSPKYVPLEAGRTEADHAQLLHRVEAAVRTIEAGNFTPANPDDWCCSPKWCGWWDQCPQGARQVAVVPLISPDRLRVRKAA